MSEDITAHFYGKYSRAAMFLKGGSRMAAALHDIDTRITELEKKANPDLKREQASKAQKVLLLHHLGILDGFRNLNTTGKNRARILSVVIDCDPDVEKVLNSIIKKDPKIISEYNYRFLVDFFEKYGLDKQANECQKILDRILNAQEVNKLKK